VRDWLIFKADAKNYFIFFLWLFFTSSLKTLILLCALKKHGSFLLIYKIALSVGLCVYISMKTGIQAGCKILIGALKIIPRGRMHEPKKNSYCLAAAGLPVRSGGLAP